MDQRANSSADVVERNLISSNTHRDQETSAYMDADSMKEACGVVGVYVKGEDVARVAFFGIYALQHRGQESAGIATADGERIRTRTSMGLVSQAFQEDHLTDLPGHIAIGHTRYSTTGSSNLAGFVS